MIKDFMKAKAMFLMVLTFMVGITGFGQTTSDLNKNSTANINPMGDMVIVVTNPVINQDVFSIEAPQANAKDFIITSTKNECLTIKIANDSAGILQRFCDSGLSADAIQDKIEGVDPYLRLYRNARDGFNWRSRNFI